MQPRNRRHLRFSIGCARFAFRFGYIASLVNLVCLNVTAQTPDAVNAPAPVAPVVPTAPVPEELPAAPAPPTAPGSPNSAATVVDSNLTASESGALPAGAGPTPVSGPGSSPASGLGERLGSAVTATKLPFRLTATLGEIYKNNIFGQPHKVDDFITRLGVTGEVRLGDLQATDGNYFDALYNPTLHLYAKHSGETGVDQDVDVFYGHHWTRLTLSLEQIYTKTQETDASIGGLVTGQVFSTIAKAKFDYSARLDLVASVKQQFTSYDQANYTDSKEWTGDLYALYHVDPKLSLGIGPRFGYLAIDRAPDETFQQIRARAAYVVSDRLNFQGAVGGEYREYQTDARSNTIEPIFEFSGVYLPQPSTSLSVNAARRFTPSYNFIGQDYIATNVYFTGTQRFFRDYYLGVSAGYENDDYQFVAAAAAGPTREDNYFYIQPSVRWRPIGWLEVAAFDKYEQDSSNFNAFTYDTNQVGVSCSATY
jgi:hypothetical protein